MNQKNIRTTLRQWETEDMKTIAHLGAIDQLTAKDAMIAPVFLKESDNVDTILKKLRHEHIYTCIVVNQKKRFVWEISWETIISLFLQQLHKEPMIKYLTRGYKKWFLYKTAKELCHKHKSIVHLDTNINTVIKYIYTEWFTYIPVVNEQKEVVGVVTASSLINLLRHY